MGLAAQFEDRRIRQQIADMIGVEFEAFDLRQPQSARAAKMEMKSWASIKEAKARGAHSGATDDDVPYYGGAERRRSL